MKTFNYAKDKSIQLDDAIVAGIITCHKNATRAHSAYISKDQDLRDSMKGLVQACLDNALNRSQGGKILASIVGIEHLKNDRPLANAWQYAAEALPSRQKESNSEGKEKAVKPTDESIETQIKAECLAVAVALEQNNINNMTTLLLSLLTADQVDAVAKRFNDHIASRRTMTAPKQKGKASNQGNLLKAS